MERWSGTAIGFWWNYFLIKRGRGNTGLLSRSKWRCDQVAKSCWVYLGTWRNRKGVRHSELPVQDQQIDNENSPNDHPRWKEALPENESAWVVGKESDTEVLTARLARKRFRCFERGRSWTEPQRSSILVKSSSLLIVSGTIKMAKEFNKYLGMRRMVATSWY